MDIKKLCLEHTLNLVNIASETGNKKGLKDVSDYLRELADEYSLGFKCDDDYNVEIIQDNGAKNTFLFVGHIDTVSGFPPVTLKNNSIYGRGSTDMKSGVFAMFLAMALEKNPNWNLRLAVTSDEEKGHTGIMKLVKDVKGIRFAVVGEPTRLDIIIGHLGRCQFEVSFKGVAGHAGVGVGVNAIEKMAKAIRQIQKISLPIHPLLGTTRITPSIISGGLSPNMIPDNVDVTMDVRLSKDIDIDELVIEAKKAFESVTGMPAKVEINKANIPSKPYILKDDDFLDFFKDMCTRCKLKPDVEVFKATTESGYLYEHAGVQSIIFGPGNIDVAHSVDEFVDIDQIVKAVDVYRQIIRNLDVLVKK